MRLGRVSTKLKAEIVTVKPQRPGAPTVKGDPLVISGPGEYGSAVFLSPMHTRVREKETGPHAYACISWILALTVAHLGRVFAFPTQSDVEAMGSVNIALVPIGRRRQLNAEAAEVISMLEPNIVIPMYYDTRPIPS